MATAGTIITHSNYMGSAFNRLTYDAYGIPGSANTDRFGYTGQIWFKELGLFHYKARMCHLKLGRFLQTDPIFYADQMYMYAYVGNDPVNKIDPTGLYECTERNGLKTCEGTQEEVGKMLEEMKGYRITSATSGFRELAFENNSLVKNQSYLLSSGKGERRYTAKPEGTSNPGKHYKPHPTDPNKVIYKDPNTGKKVIKPKPSWFEPKVIPLFLPLSPELLEKTLGPEEGEKRIREYEETFGGLGCLS